jgi:hypothetical protein
MCQIPNFITWSQKWDCTIEWLEFSDHPIQLNVCLIRLDDFSILEEKRHTHMFAFDIEFHTHAEDGREAERKVPPYLEKKLMEQEMAS